MKRVAGPQLAGMPDSSAKAAETARKPRQAGAMPLLSAAG